MVPARWEGAGAGLSWITMTKQKKENTQKTYTHPHTLLWFGSTRIFATVKSQDTHTDIIIQQQKSNEFAKMLFVDLTHHLTITQEVRGGIL